MESTDEEADASAASDSPGLGRLPPSVITAFLQQQQRQQPALPEPGIATPPRDGQPTAAAAPLAAARPAVPAAGGAAAGRKSSGVAARQSGGVAGGSRQATPPGRGRSLRRRLLRLLRHVATAGLAAGVCAGAALLARHLYGQYLETLDDRDTLTRRVAELQHTEEKLLGRCMGLEGERDQLAARGAELARSLAAGGAERAALAKRLAAVEGDREEAVRHNLRLQGLLQRAEEQGRVAAAEAEEARRAAAAAHAEAARLGRELDAARVSVQKLEARCAVLEAASAEMRRQRSTDM